MNQNEVRKGSIYLWKGLRVLVIGRTRLGKTLLPVTVEVLRRREVLTVPWEELERRP